MADILLVHGSAHGAWAWRDTLPALQALGHRVRAIDLPGHGDDPTHVNEVTQEMYAEAIIDALTQPMVVVGHSMAGYPISLVAERRPDLVQHLVYLCAYVPAPGLTLAQMRLKAPRQPLLAAFQKAEDGKSFTFDPAQIKQRFYADCSDEQIAFAADRLCPQSIATSDAVVDLTERYASVPRSYIRCMQDGAIPYEFQITMTADWPEGRVVDMDTSHSPFFSAPADLARQITGLID